MMTEQTAETTIVVDRAGSNLTVRATVRVIIPGEWPWMVSMHRSYPEIPTALPWHVWDSAFEQQIRDAASDGVGMTPGLVPPGGLHIEVSALELDPPLPADVEVQQLRTVGRAVNRVISGMIAGLLDSLQSYAPPDRLFRETVRVIGLPIVSKPMGASCHQREEFAQQLSLQAALRGLVDAFQRFAESTYPQLPKAPILPRRTLSRDVRRASRRWQRAGGAAFDTILEPAEFHELLRLFEQVRLIDRQDGIVDQRYVDCTEGAGQAIGQALRLSEEDFTRSAEVLEKLVRRIQVT